MQNKPPMDGPNEISAATKKLEKKIVESLIKKTHFSCQEIERLLNLYRSTVVLIFIVLSSSKTIFLGGSRSKIG